MNNRIYGMTGGQFSPLSGPGKKATTAPYLTIDSEFDIARLAEAAGATFVARSTTYHAQGVYRLPEKSHRPQRFFGGRDPLPVPDPLRPQEQGR
jgi:2-oxoglutarate ferredoxin oxidoreductase subunit beta